jgi:putative transposase
VKYAWIDQHRAMYPLALMCALLAVSINGFRVRIPAKMTGVSG